ncbi:MAG: DUF4465 domain-containing protein [Planctomycetota bacterium]
MIRKGLILTPLVTLSIASASSTALSQTFTVIDFNDLSLPADSFFNGGPTTNTDGWSSNGADFGNSFNSSFGGFWNGFSYSNVDDTTTPGVGNQYAAITGTDATTGTGDSGIYAVAFSGSNDFINLPDGQTPVSVELTNTTYATFSMLNGDSFAKAFGGVTGDDPDFFDVILTGYDAADGSSGTGNETGSVTFRLADYTFADNNEDFIVDTWNTVDLSGLGNAQSIGLSWASSDVGQFGINTPTYVALDNLVLVPEPTVLATLAAAGLFTARRRRHA